MQTPAPARPRACECVRELVLGNRAGRIHLCCAEQEGICTSSAPSSRAGIRAEQRALQHRRGNPCALRNSSGLPFGGRGPGCAAPPGMVQAPGECRRDAASLGHWGHLPGAAESILLGSLGLWGGGSRKQAGCINSQPNEYTKIAALLLLSSGCGH